MDRISRPAAASGNELAFLKRSDAVAEQIKLWVIERNLVPGDRLPPERGLMEAFGVSKGTMREALKSLEVQGLIRIAMGPGGGAALTEVTDERVMNLLGSYFYHRDPTIADIYQVWILLEPEVAASAVGRFTQEKMDGLEQLLETSDSGNDDPEGQRRKRIEELKFHEIIADACPNPCLAFACKFMLKLLRDIVVIGRMHEIPLQEMSHANHCYHQELLEAIATSSGRSCSVTC